MENNSGSIKVPTLLSFDPTRKWPNNLVPGRGEAGWTVYEFVSAKDALHFMDTHTQSTMPCWERIRQKLND